MDMTTHSEQASPTKGLPVPLRERWQPLRSGFVNLYRYDREEFHYENGRILLRGNNGTGKSRVLALQLPFLLDGEVIPQRLEPDADPAKRVEWNLLMGRYPDRTGYTWIEFGRREQSGREHFLTLGCGLNAVEGQSGVRKWFFVTPQRIGVDLDLTSETRQVIGKDRLRERLGASGQIFDTATAYRNAVNQALFGLDEYRYVSFVNLLIQLRRPQLTRRLDENELARALSEALPPMSPAVISKVSDAFSQLETERTKLEALKAAHHAVEQFLATYREYATIAAHRRIDRVRAVHQEYETAMQEILRSESDYDQSLAQLANMKAEMNRIHADQMAVRAEISTLEESLDSKDAKNLERAHRDAEARRKAADAAASESVEASQMRKARADEFSRSSDALEQRVARLKAAAEAAGQLAEAAGTEDLHAELAGLIAQSDTATEEDFRQLRSRLELAIQTQSEKTQHLKRLRTLADSRRVELEHSAARRDQLFGLLDDGHERLNTARHEHNIAINAFLATACEWSTALKELPIQVDEPLLNAMAEWCESPQNANPLTGLIQQSVETITNEIQQQLTGLDLVEKAHAKEVDQLRRHSETIRKEEARETSGTGSPLWKLCDFAEDFDPSHRGGIEGALQASGLLNAWVTPSGEFLETDGGNPILVAAASPLPPEDLHLGLILQPSTGTPQEDGRVPAYVVADILRHIGIAPESGPAWVSPDGRWQNGVLRGMLHKEAPEFIGQTARDAAHGGRMLDLDTAIIEAQDRLDAVAATIDGVNRRLQTVRTEAESVPTDETVRATSLKVGAASTEVERLRRRLGDVEEHLAQKRVQMDEAVANHDRMTVELGIARWIDDLDSLEHGISNYSFALASLWPAAESVFEARALNQSAWMHLEGATRRESRLAEMAGEAEQAAASSEIAQQTLKNLSGAALGDTIRRLDDARSKYGALITKDKEARRRHHETELAITRLDERLRNLTEMLNVHTERRNAAAASLQSFATTSLLRIAVPGEALEPAPTWSVNRTVEIAFDLVSKLDVVEGGDLSWEHHQKAIPAKFNALMQILSTQGCQASAIFRDEVFVAVAAIAGRECSIDELSAILIGEAQSRRSVLDAKEKEILENHLIGDVSSHLHGLLTASEDQLRQMNAELESRPMSTGMKLRFVWKPIEDGPFGENEIRKTLTQPPDSLSEEQRQTLGRFLQQQIQAAGSHPEHTTWKESLASALDYRKWHRFAVERYQEGVWRLLTRRTHGTGSGGEKAVALTLPHFSAVAAFYRTADPLAPRLILLDEAFVGIDADMRAKCMGLIHAFDLDFMMTSEREWGCYATLPGLAIYHLSTRPGIDAINLTRWVWNGKRRALNTTTESVVDMATAGDLKTSREQVATAGD